MVTECVLAISLFFVVNCMFQCSCEVHKVLWYITLCGCTSVESMHVASSPVQTSSGQQPMDLADYLSVKIHLVVSQFLELVLEAVNGIYLDCWLLQTVPAIWDVHGEAKAGKLCT